MDSTRFEKWAALVRKKHEIDAELLIAERILHLVESEDMLPPPEDPVEFSAHLELRIEKIDPDRYYNKAETAKLIDAGRTTLYDWIPEFFPDGEKRGELTVWRGELIIEWLRWRETWNGSDLKSYHAALQGGRCEPFDG